ncbi:MAG: cation/multidrug efflux pump [Gammaproteobacteria bacterium]|nr:cation/multidrug efflux pump [Gammaproteobacteria bacterium]MCI0591159.1 cation/multidrug efflux pump [Gammaproteobacteria bacterium]
MAQINLIIIGLALLGLGLVVLGVARLRKARVLAAGSYGLLGIALLVGAALLFGFSLNLHTYHRLTHEEALAQLTFKQVAPQRYEVTIEYPDNESTRRYELTGDEWQIDARILKWHRLAALMGLNAQYRLERLSGRYRHVGEERNMPRSVYALTSDDGLDLWQLAERYNRWLPWVDAIYGSAAYLPMADMARYHVSITQTGLIAREVSKGAHPIGTERH